MPTTILQGFAKFSSNLEITGLQAQTVSTRQQNVRDTVAAGFTVLDSFLTGSYKRSTMIAPLSQADVDLFVVLDSSYFTKFTQKDLLEEVRTALRKEYPTTPRFSKNGQAVTITFSDFQVDVVPAFYRQGGGYLIPNANSNQWISTDPTKHEAIWTEQNKWHQGDLVPFIKMIKCWNREHSGFLRSFHLETVVLETLRNVTMNDWPSAVRYFFDKARTTAWSPINDPAGYSGDLTGYLFYTDKVEVQKRAQAAYDRALQAEGYIKDCYIADAYGRYRIIFGDYFPAYG
ncbi:hypothetical protein IMCC26134_10445 [Verrucomicrobia bacterium IMCC26134]|nr:hypothetical protein IMCC26134_10445 [Verrucomicrobia bacterium IMCC26134]